MEGLLFTIGLCSGVAVLLGAHCSVWLWALPQVTQRAHTTPVPWELPGAGNGSWACPTPSQEQAAPALGVSLCLTQGQAGMWGAGPAGTWLGHWLIALGADVGGRGDGPAAQALEFGFWVKEAKGWLVCG